MPDVLAKTCLAALVVLGVAVVAFVAYLRMAPGPAPVRPFVADSDPVPPPATDSDDWGRYYTDDGVLSIQLPKAPQRRIKPAPESPKSAIHILEVPHELNGFWVSLRYSVIPDDQDAPIDDQLRSIRETFPLHMEAAKQKPVTVAGERRLELAGERGIELALECDGKVTLLRVFLISGKMYTAALTAPLSKRNDPWVERFFNSLNVSKERGRR
jgi:hypothetical protein